jgi:ribonuclease Z
MSDHLSLTFLGTGASLPSKRRGMPSLVIRKDGEYILCDCSEGTQQRIMQANIPPSRIRTILISHLHGDHIFGIPGFITSQQMTSRSNPLRIIGPNGLQKYLGLIRDISGYSIDYPLEIDEISGVMHEFKAGSFYVTAHLLDHQGQPCYGFRLQEKDKLGKFDSKKADALGIPQGPERAALLRGGNIVLADGRTIEPNSLVGPMRPGRVIVYCTDTKPCQAAVELAKKCDLLVYDSTFADDHAELANESGHSTSRQAALLAEKAVAKQLVLWHISPRYDEEQEQLLLQQAREVFPNTLLPYDLQTLILPPRNG